MSAKNLMGGAATAVSGYVESKIDKECETCRSFSEPNFCKHKIVLKDPKVKTDKKSGLKIVNPEYGCCNFWQADPKAEDKN
jgi:hypothetical protein